ncbi:hypothetical protein CsSME_00039108 [Camellia sinensis var. sinensis]
MNSSDNFTSRIARGKMSSSNSANNTQSAFDAEDDKQLWKYVTRLEKSDARGGNCTFQYNFCQNNRNLGMIHGWSKQNWFSSIKESF